MKIMPTKHGDCRGKRAKFICPEDLNGPSQEIIDEVCKPFIVHLHSGDVISTDVMNAINTFANSEEVKNFCKKITEKLPDHLGGLQPMDFEGRDMTIINRWSDHIDSPENNPIYVGNPSDEIWTTKDEQRIRVGDMTDDHIRNCYNMVMNTRSEYWQNVFKAEIEKRGNRI